MSEPKRAKVMKTVQEEDARPRGLFLAWRAERGKCTLCATSRVSVAKIDTVGVQHEEDGPIERGAPAEHLAAVAICEGCAKGAGVVTTARRSMIVNLVGLFKGCNPDEVAEALSKMADEDVDEVWRQFERIPT